MNLFSTLLKPRLKPNGVFYDQIKSILGFTPKVMAIYEEAFTHRSMNLKNDKGNSVNYERLEFLGDAMLGTIVSAYLFEQYDSAKEGELTNLRAKIVSRENLNAIGQKMGLMEWVESTHPKASFIQCIRH